MKQSIVFLDRATLDAPLREPTFDHDYVEYDVTTESQIVERLRHATVAITNKVKLSAETISRLPDLKLIAVAATGTDIVDKAAAKEAGIVVVNIRNYAYDTVPEHVLALLFALRRSLFAYARDVRAGDWEKSDQFCLLTYPIGDIAGSTLGIVGYGVIGKALAKRAEALGMRVLATDPVAQPGLVDLETILRESDAITLHAPLTDETRNMIGAAELAKMKKTAILINTGRGGLVDESALAEALRAGTIAGAGFDVLTNEPPTGGNVLLDPKIPNLIVTPHVAWASAGAMRVLAEQLVDNVEAFVAGKPQNVVG